MFLFCDECTIKGLKAVDKSAPEEKGHEVALNPPLGWNYRNEYLGAVPKDCTHVNSDYRKYQKDY